MAYFSMVSMTRPCVALAFAVACSVAGCGGEGGESNDPIPKDLAALETAAETAFDQALLANATAVQEQARLISEALTRYQQQASKDGVPASALQRLTAAVQGLVAAAANHALSAIDLARTANAVSAPMEEIYTVYNPPAPPRLLTLDYLGREVILDAKDANFVRALADVNSLDTNWQSLRAKVASTAGGASAAAQFDAAITALRAALAASNAATLEAAARQVLDIVDTIEALFVTDKPD